MLKIKRIFAFVLLAAMICTAFGNLFISNTTIKADSIKEALPSSSPVSSEDHIGHSSSNELHSNVEESNGSSTIHSQSASEVAISFLRDAVNTQYFGEQSHFEQYTFNGLAENDRAALTAKLSGSVDTSANAARKDKSGTDDKAKSVYDEKELEYCMRNLEYHRKSVVYYEHVNKLYVSGYKFFTPTYETLSSEETDETATVEIREDLEYQYDNVEFTSGSTIDYKIRLVRDQDTWVVMTVWSNDELSALPEEFDLEAEIDNLYEAYAKYVDHDERGSGYDFDESGLITAETTPPPANTSTDILYNSSNAKNYALTYASRAASNQDWKNPRFHYGGADCVRFVSQCMWAGFWGSNDTASINSKQGMDALDSYTWYGTNTQDSDGYYESAPWRYTPSYKSYMNGLRGSTSESGIVSSIKNIAPNQNDLLVGTTGTGLYNDNISQYDLVGATLLVKGKVDQVATPLRHAVIITNQSSGGHTRDTVYFSAYNARHRNKLLSSITPVQSSNSSDLHKIFVAVPRYFRGANSSNSNYLKGTLKPAIAPSSALTYVYGGSRDVAPTLIIWVYKPNASTPCATAKLHGVSTISTQVAFDTIGEWTIVVSSPGLSSYSYTVRVAATGELGND